MKHLFPFLILFCQILAAPVASTAKQLLPGVSFYGTEHTLAGKLIFHIWSDNNRITNSATMASIYELDLSTGKIDEIVKSPKGFFFADEFGDIVGVNYWDGNWFNGSALQGRDTNVFIYSKVHRQKRVIGIPGDSRATVVLAGHVFFEVDKIERVVLIDYNYKNDTIQIIKLPDASRWEREQYSRIHASRSATNGLHFYYSGFGQHFGGGQDYRAGFYNLNASTGEIDWFASLLDDDDGRHVHRTLDNRYVYFECPGAPLNGVRLVSSRWSELWVKERDPRRSQISVIKDFSKISHLSSGGYSMLQMSPDHRFALVKHSASKGGQKMPVTINTYLTVDISTGVTTPLIRDEVQSSTGGFMSKVLWRRGDL